MKIKKRILSILLCAALLFSVMPISTFAANIASDSGWHIDSAGCLHITGSFSSTGNSSYDKSPWRYYKDNIVSVVAEEGAQLDPEIANPCMSRLFQDCTNLVSVNLDNLDTSNVYMMEKMFLNCTSLESISLPNFDVQNVIYFDEMFRGCTSLKEVDISSFYFFSVKNAKEMFKDCTSLETVNLGSFLAALADDVSGMFENCTSLKTVNSYAFSPNRANAMNLFKNCESLESISLPFYAPTQGATQSANVSGMFSGCTNLKNIEMPSFDAADVRSSNIDNMLTGCDSLNKIQLSGANSIRALYKQLLKVSPIWVPSPDSSVKLYSEGSFNSLGTDTVYRYQFDTFNIKLTDTGSGGTISGNFSSIPGISGYVVSAMRCDSVEQDFIVATQKKISGNSFSFSSKDLGESYGGADRWKIKVDAIYSSYDKYYDTYKDNIIVSETTYEFGTGLPQLETPKAKFGPDGVLHWHTVPNADGYVVRLYMSKEGDSGVYGFQERWIEYNSYKLPIYHYTEARVDEPTASLDLTTVLNIENWELKYNHYCTIFAISKDGKYISSDVAKSNEEAYFGGQHYDVWVDNGWYLDSEGCLHIVGAVHNPANSISGAAPWDSFRNDITSVVTLPGASVDNCYKLFYNCSNLISADLSNLNTVGVEKFAMMFSSCAKLESVDLSGINTSSAKSMESMFYNCGSLESIDLGSFNTTNVTNMNGMFEKCGGLTALDLGGFRTSKVTDMRNMFNGCSSLKTLDINGFDIGNVNDMENFLNNCTALSEISTNDNVLERVAVTLDNLAPNGWVNKETGEKYLTPTQLRNIIGKVALAKITNVGLGWYLDGSGCLHVVGAVTNTSTADTDNTPWKDYKPQIITVVTQPGASVSSYNYLFYGCRNLKSVDLSQLPAVQGAEMYNTFAYCRNLSSVDIGNIESIFRPDTVFNETATLRKITASKTAISSLAYTLTDISFSWLNVDTDDVYENTDLRGLGGKDTVTLTRFVKIKDDNWYIDMADCLHILKSVTNNTEERGRDQTPWTSYKSEITSVVVEDNIRGIYISNTADRDNYRALFSGCVNLTSVDLSKLSISNAETMDTGNMLLNCANLNEITANGILLAEAASELLAISPTWYLIGTGTAYRSVSDFKDLTGTVTLTTDAVTDKGDGWYLDNMGCLHIIGAVKTTLGPDGTCFPWEIYNTQINSAVTVDGAYVDTCENMFKDCVNLTTADLSRLDTSDVFSMSWMFSGCKKLISVNANGFNTENAEYMIGTFDGCIMLYELDLSGFRAIDDIVYMDNMFTGCNRLFRLKFGNFAPMLAYTDDIFFGCVSLSEIEINDRVLSGFDNIGNITADQLISISPVWTGADGTVYTDANEIINNHGAVVLTRGNSHADESYSVSGTVVSKSTVYTSDTTIVSIFKAGEDTALKTATVSGLTGNYEFTEIEAGNYIVKIERPYHATREYIVTVSSDTTQNAEIRLCGDVNGDGEILVDDYSAAVNAALASDSAVPENLSPDENYIKAVADFDCDGVVDVLDIVMIERKTKHITA